MVPIAAAMGIAAAGAYPAVTAVGVPRIIDTASCLPVEIFVVGAVGVVPLVAAVWVGLAIGRLVPVLVTAPALAAAGIGLLLIIPVATGKREWLAFVFSPMYGMSLYADYQTIDNRVSVAQPSGWPPSAPPGWCCSWLTVRGLGWQRCFRWCSRPPWRLWSCREVVTSSRTRSTR
jgi:hypothetical protein